MLLCFPSACELRDAIRRELAPAELRRQAALGGIDARGRVWLRTAAKLHRAVAGRLRRAGVEIDPKLEFEPAEPIGDWAELLPLIRAGDESPDTVILEFGDAQTMVRAVAEMQRMGHERHSFRWLPKSDGALLQVAGPPLFTLLRAGRRDAPAPRAYVEQAPGVWVELGFRHPLAGGIAPEPGQFLLLNSPRRWRRIAEEPFHPTRSLRPFPVGSPRLPRDRDDLTRIPIRLRLSPANRTEPPELWLLRGDGAARLADFVREADERMLARIDFACAEAEAGRIVLLKSLHGRGGPPVVIADADPFVSAMKFPNFFVPQGYTVYPPLRRDLIRELFATDSRQITWLRPTGDSIRAHSVAVEAFRPLSAAVDYLVEQSSRIAAPISPALPFDFEPFIERIESVRPAKSRSPHEGTHVNVASIASPIKVVKGAAPSATKPATTVKPKEPAPELAAMPDAQLRERLAQLQRQFIEAPGSLDALDRRSLWTPLAELHGRLALLSDAAICWLNVIWADEPPPDLIHGWLRVEQQAAGQGLSAGRLDLLLTESAPLPEQVRFVALHLIASLYLAPSPLLLPRMGALVHFLEQFDSWLPARGAWLAWLGLYRLTGDRLALTRARDRLLNQLLESGLNRDRDLPSFLRGRDAGTGAALAAEHEQLRSLHRKAHAWPSGDKLIIDLIFAYGFARLGQAASAQELLEVAERKAKRSGHAPYWLMRAYQQRIRVAIHQETSGGLPAALLAELLALSSDDARQVNLRRRASRILEPFEKIDPFRDYREFRDDTLGRELAHLARIADPAEIGRRLAALRRPGGSARYRLRALAAALAYAPRIGEGFALDLLADLEAAFPEMPKDPDQFRVVELLESGLLLAAHTGHDERIPELVRQLHATLGPVRGERLAWLVARLTGPLFRTLGKLGLADEVRRLVDDLTEGILERRTLSQLRKTPAVNWGIVLRALTHLAGGWFYLGKDEFALQILDEARDKLFQRTLRDQEQAELAESYTSALGQAPPESAWPRIHELFDRLGQLDVSTQNAALHQCEMRVLESAVLAVAAKDFATGSRVRRWLDEDEYLIRRRIHADMQRVKFA